MLAIPGNGNGKETQTGVEVLIYSFVSIYINILILEVGIKLVHKHYVIVKSEAQLVQS